MKHAKGTHRSHVSASRFTRSAAKRGILDKVAKNIEKLNEELVRKFICSICSAEVFEGELRNHLCEHNSQAASLEWEEVETFFTPKPRMRKGW